MTGLAALPCGLFCEGCRWWMPNHPDRCGHRLWKELTALDSLPKSCPLGLLVAGGEPEQNPQHFNLLGGNLPDPRNAKFGPLLKVAVPVGGHLWGSRVLTSKLTVEDGHYRLRDEAESVTEAVAERAAAQFHKALRKLMGDESDALSLLETLALLRRKLRAEIQELLNAQDDPFSSWEDGKRDAFEEVLRMLDEKLKKLAGLERGASG